MQAGAVIAQRYKIERELGKGGCGAVYVAIDGKFGERVALKLAAAHGNDYESFCARFEREAKIGNKLGKIPGVVRAFDWGRVGQAGLYLAMDLVPDARPLDLETGTLEEKLVRLREAAKLVAAAHKERVVHRDVKPANFLQGSDGRIWLTDFGLAKVQGSFDKAADTGVSTLTQRGDVMGTPNFMPPEQFDDVSSVDERADVYALGVMLYFAVTGKPPFEARSSFELRMKLENVKSGSQKHPRLSLVNPGVPPEIDALAFRAMAMDRNSRLPSADDFVAALDAILAGNKQTAKAIAQKSVVADRKASPVAILAGVVLLAAVVTGGVLFAVGRKTTPPPPPVIHDGDKAQDPTTTVATPTSEATVAPPTTATETLPAETTPVVETPHAVPETPGPLVADVPEGALGRLGTLRLRHGRDVSAIAFAPDTKTLLTADLMGTVTVWSVPDGAPRDELNVAHEGAILRTVAISPRAGLVLGSDQTGRVSVTSVLTRREVASFAGPAPVRGLAASHDETLVAASWSGAVSVWRVDAKTSLVTLPESARATKLAFSPDGTLLAAGCDDSKTRLWSIPEGKLVATLGEHTGSVTAVEFSKDGKLLATGSADRTVRIWSVPDGAPLGVPFPAHRAAVSDLALSPDAKWLVTVGNPNVALWSTDRRDRIVTPLVAPNPRVLAFSADGTWVAAGCFGGGVALFDAKSGDRVAGRSDGHTDEVEAIAFSKGGELLASGSTDHSLELWDVGWKRGTATLTALNLAWIHAVATLPDGRFVSGGGDGIVHVWTGTRSWVLYRHPRVIGFKKHAIAVSPDGTLVASARPDTPIALVTVPEKPTPGDASTAELRAPRLSPRGLAFSPDGKLLAAASSDGTVRIFSVESKKQVRSLPGPPKIELHAVVFSPDGRTLVAGGGDGRLHFWSTDMWKPLALELEGHAGFINSIAYSPDGKLLATGGEDRLVRVHDMVTGKTIATRQGHRGAVRAVAFSPDGKVLASGSTDSTIVLWDAARLVEPK